MGKTNWKTGKRLKFAEPQLETDFLLMYCDNFWPLNLDNLYKFHKDQKKSVTVTVYSNLYGSTKSNIFVNSENLVEIYDKNRLSENMNGVEIGFYIMPKSFVYSMPNDNFPLEEYLFPQLIPYKELAGFLTNHKYYSVGSLERLSETEDFLKERKYVFLDRDGVINEKAPKAKYITNWSDFKFINGSIEALEKLSKNNYEIYIITNQAGIARKKMSLGDLKIINDNLLSNLSKHNIIVNEIFFCPHGWDDGCFCRKPEPGLLFHAAFKNKINLTKSILVGDDERDIMAGRKADCLGLYLVNGDNSLLDITKKIISNES